MSTAAAVYFSLALRRGAAAEASKKENLKNS